MNLDKLIAGIRSKQRLALAQGITLLESTRAEDRQRADELLTKLMPFTGKSLRIGISGIPGVGKSTFVEALGAEILKQHPTYHIACLTTDPSSPVHGGSILGDKIRMQNLAVHPQVFIRSSPSEGYLGGTARHTREVMLLLEAAGFDLCLIETVGVGQSEAVIATMVDVFLLLVMPFGGDEIQSIKKGMQELADLIIVNKADGELLLPAQQAFKQIAAALQLLGHFHKKQPSVHLCSARLNQGIEGILQAIEAFAKSQRESQDFTLRRKTQAQAWFEQEFTEILREQFLQKHQKDFTHFQEQVIAGKLPASIAARHMINK